MGSVITINTVRDFLKEEKEAIKEHGIKGCYLKIIKSWTEPGNDFQSVRLGYRGIEICMDFVISMWEQDGEIIFGSCYMEQCSLYVKDGSFCVSSYSKDGVSLGAGGQIMSFINKFQSNIKLKSSPIRKHYDNYNKYSKHLLI